MMLNKISRSRELVFMLIMCFLAVSFGNIIARIPSKATVKFAQAHSVDVIEMSDELFAKTDYNELFENELSQDSVFVDEYVYLITDTYHFLSNSNIVVSFAVDTIMNIDDFTYATESFIVLNIEKSKQKNNQIDIVLQADNRIEINNISIEIVLSSGTTKIARLFGMVSECGTYISPFSEDDAREKYLVSAKEKGKLTQEEYENIQGELSRRGVKEESYTIEAKSSALMQTASAGKDTYVSGNLQWIDDAGNPHPIRRVMVTIFDYDIAGTYSQMGTVFSDNAGNYSFTFQNPDSFWDFENGGADIFIRVYPGDNNAMVKRGENSSDYYYESGKQAHMDVATGSNTVLSLSIDMATDWGRAFQISQALLTARDFAWNMKGSIPSDVTVRYPFGNNCSYNNGTKRISITGNPPVAGSPESYASWDVIMHEYGHHIQYDLGIIDSPGGGHFINSNMIDHYAGTNHTNCDCVQPGSSQAKNAGTRLVWSESWPTVFGLIAQKYWRSYLQNMDTTICDTVYDAYNINILLDIETTTLLQGDGGEMSVMAVLWDLYDSGSETNDTIALGYQAWWDITTGGGDKTFSSFIARFYSAYPQYVDDIGANLSYYRMAPTRVNPALTATALTTTPPTFNWTAQGGSTSFPNNNFEIKFYNENFSSEMSITTTATSRTLTASQWNTILGWAGEKIYVAVIGYQTNSPSTGGYVSEYREYTKPIYTTSVLSGKVTITGTYCQLLGSIQIPSSIDGLPVTGIGAQAFRNQASITSVTLPSTINTIGNRAFQFCYSLATINMSSTSVTRIEDYTFDTCSITNISFPSNLTYIGEGAFIRAGNIVAIPTSITSIGDYAFANTISTSYVIPSTITNIGYKAFDGCNSLTIYSEQSGKLSTWNASWNSSNRPVVWGCTLSSDKSYVISFTKSVNNPSSTSGLSDPYRKDYNFGGWSTTSGGSSAYTTANIGSVPNGTTLYAVWNKPSCVAEGSLITLADGSQIAVEDLTGDELLLVWNLLTGTFDAAPILFIDSDPFMQYEIIHLYFSDGTDVKVISEHAFWDINLNQYVFLRNDAAQYIGHWFNKQAYDANGNMIWTAIQLVDVQIYTEYTTTWSPVTFGHLCYYVNGMLSMPGATTGLINIFEVDSDAMQINQEAFLADIQTYGLFTYEEFAEIAPIPEIVFEAFGGQFLKVSLGKGLINWDEINALLARYAPFFAEDNSTTSNNPSVTDGNNGNHYGQLKNGNNGNHYGQLKKNK